MSTPARYWRVSWRTTDSTSSSSRTITFATMNFATANGTLLSPASAVLTTGTHLNATTFPLTNLWDDNATTSWVARYSMGGSNQLQNLFTITFDFGAGNDVLPDQLLLRTLMTTHGSDTAMSGTILDFFIDASTDNITYSRRSLVYRPILADDTLVRVPASGSSSIYPVPSADLIGGAGGIYGIVSEDGVALPNRPVVLFERDSFFKVAWTNTDANGGYAFNGLNPQREFMVMSYDPSGPPFKNAIVWDRITPINTLGNIPNQSAFWARRARDPNLGSLVSSREYLDGATHNFIAGSILGNTERRWWLPDGYGYDPVTAVGGSLKFLRGNRTPTFTGEGLVMWPGNGTFTGVNAAGVVDNFRNLTFEYIIRTPEAGSTFPMYIVWGGTRDSDDLWLGGGTIGYGSGTVAVFAGGPTLEITAAGVLNVRFPLNGRNRSTVRATTNLIPGTVYHIMVTYAQDSELKLFVNGVLTQTTAISGAGRLWGHPYGPSSSSNTVFTHAFESWDSLSGSTGEGAIRRFITVTVAGNGANINNATSVRAGGPGYGGSWALLALYNRTFTDAEVATFYDSFVNWETHTVLPTQPGYMGEVEADNPKFYVRMNDLVQPSRIQTLFGHRDYGVGQYEGVPVYNQLGFVSGATSVRTSNGGLRLDRVELNSIFTVEFFCRPSSTTGTQRLFLSRANNSVAPVFMSMVNGFLRLNITDVTGTDTLLQFSQLLVAGTAYHIAVSYDPWNDKQCRLYVDGGLVQTLPAATIPSTVTDWFFIGVNGSGSGPTYSERFQGEIGEFAIYNYVVPAARIQAHFNARNA